MIDGSRTEHVLPLSSLLGVPFKNMINFYGISKNTLELRDINLYDTDLNVPVSGMCFRYKNNSHLFVEVRGEAIKIWNIFDQKVIWSYNNSSPLLNVSIDPISNQMSSFRQITIWSCYLSKKVIQRKYQLKNSVLVTVGTFSQ